MTARISLRVLLLLGGVGSMTLGTIPAGLAALPQERNVTVPVILEETGEGAPVALRWKPADRAKGRIQVSTRTVPTNLERPNLDDVDPDVLLTAFSRPPIERMWSLSGVLAAAAEGDGRIVRWRIENGAARLVGFRPPAADPADAGDPDPSDAADDEDRTIGASPDPATPSRTDAAEDEEEAPLSRRTKEARDLTSPNIKPAENSDADAIRRAMRLEALSNEALAGTEGAMISQRFERSGLDPGDPSVRLLEADRRAEYEARRLVGAMTLADVQLPAEPVGIGAKWSSTWTQFQSGRRVRIDATWTLLEVDEDAEGAGFASTARLRVEYRRRMRDPGGASDNLKRLLEVNGRGEVRIRMDQPLQPEARLVEQSILDPVAGRSREVTRIQVSMIKAP